MNKQQVQVVKLDHADVDLALIQHLFPDTYRFLFSSALQGTPQSRYSLLLSTPVDEIALYPKDLNAPAGNQFVESLNTAYQSEQCLYTDTELPFIGGWALYFSYEFAQQIEPVLNLPLAQEDIPVAIAARCQSAIIIDHDASCTYVVAEFGSELSLADIESHIHDAGQYNIGTARLPVLKQLHEESPQRYLDSIQRIKQYLYDGDVFQVNLSRLWEAHYQDVVPPVDLYRILRDKNPAPFSSCFAVRDDYWIVSSSPERLVSLQDGWIETRPIAGTRPRGANRAADEALAEELLAHRKEQAEHIMLIDLERNDMGRICLPGTIDVNELMVLESYKHVHHIVSNIRGKLKSTVYPLDIVNAIFPGGTITGCPKVRCMQIIAELEAKPRGAYTGALGYLSRHGVMDLNILIRSLVVQGNRVSLRAGGGIVADSDPMNELAESRHKARGLINALSNQHGIQS